MRRCSPCWRSYSRWPLRGAQAPPCFGAAARDPERACTNAALERTVSPSPARARTLPEQPVPDDRDRVAAGVPVRGRRAGRRRSRWSATATPGTGGRRSSTSRTRRAGAGSRSPARAARCRRRCATCASRGGRSAGAGRTTCSPGSPRHPEVRTVFVAGLSGGSGVVPQRGTEPLRDRPCSGYLDAWAALPAPADRRAARHAALPRRHRLVRQPRAATPAARRARRARSRAAFALGRDPAIVAAGRAGREVLDLTPFFCGARCYPVIGGALVVRDANHMTGTYSATLGPYVLRALDRLTGS